MIQVSQERCTGCGTCVGICPKGALFVAGGCADVDEALCNSCGLCIAACPEEAISFATQTAEISEHQSLAEVQSQPPAKTQTRAIAPLWSRSIAPALGAAIAFAGREILPHVVETLISTRKTGDSTSKDSGVDEGKRLRRRRRGKS
jgi:Fe-S-cluster-containing hydrogenase component 2